MLIRKLNKEFNNRISEIKDLFEMIYELDTEKWNGDERYKVLNYGTMKPGSAVRALKTAVYVGQFLNGVTTQNVITALWSAYKSPLYIKIMNENGDELSNIELNKFIDMVLDKKYSEAYDIYLKSEVNRKYKR